MKAFTWEVNSVCFGPDGKKVVAGSSYDGKVVIWDLEKDGYPMRLEHGTCTIDAVCFSQNGEWVASGADDSTVRIWNAKTGKELRRLKSYIGGNSVCFGKDRNKLASGSGSRIEIWNLEEGDDESPRIFRHEVSCCSVCSVIPDEEYSACGCRNCIVSPEGPSSICSVCFSPDEKQVACGCGNSFIMWSLEKEEKLVILKGHTDRVRLVCFSKDGKKIASGAQDGTVKIWDLKKGVPCSEPKVLEVGLDETGRSAWIYSVCFVPVASKKPKQERFAFLQRKLKVKAKKVFFLGRTESGDIEPGR